MHMAWPSMAEATPAMPEAHNPHQAEAEVNPLAWDSHVPFITGHSMFCSHVDLNDKANMYGLGQGDVKSSGAWRFGLFLAVVAGGLAWLLMSGE